MREAPALVLIDKILSCGGLVKAYDPIAVEECKRNPSSLSELWAKQPHLHIGTPSLHSQNRPDHLRTASSDCTNESRHAPAADHTATPFTFLFARWIVAGSTCPNSQQSTRNGTRKEKPNGIHPKTLSTKYLHVLCQRKSVRDQIRLHGSAFAAHTKEKTRIYHKRSSYDQFRWAVIKRDSQAIVPIHHFR